MSPDDDALLLGKLLADSKEVKARALAIAAEKGLRPDEVVLLAGNLLFDVSQAFVLGAYGEWASGEREYARDYRRTVEAVKATGITPARGNACVLAWALKTMQGAELRRMGGGPK